MLILEREYVILSGGVLIVLIWCGGACKLFQFLGGGANVF